MTSIPQKAEKVNLSDDTFANFAKMFNIASLLKKANVRKARGVGVLTVFTTLLKSVFLGKSLNQLLSSEELAGKKDVFYRFIGNSSANWSAFIGMLSIAVIQAFVGFFPDRIGVLVLDDTSYKRNRSQKVELLTRIYDHTDKQFYRGFRCAALCYNDGQNFVPVDFAVLSSQEEKTRINEMAPGLDKRTNGYKIRKNAIQNSNDVCFDMIQRVKNLANHVLFDSWFSNPKMFRNLKDIGLHGVGMLKAMKGKMYLYKGEKYTLAQLYSLVKPLHRGGHVTVGVTLLDGTEFSITYVRAKHGKRKWLAIGTTDMTLSGAEVVELYSRRWSIEVFFKAAKSFLGFAKEFQGRSFDSVVCSVAIVFTRYIIFAWLNSRLPAPETYGQLFFRLFDELRKPSFSQALNIILTDLASDPVHFDETLNLSVRQFFLSFLPLPLPLPLALSCET